MVSRPARPQGRGEVGDAHRAQRHAGRVDQRGAQVAADAVLVDDRVAREARVVGHVLQDQRLAPHHDMRAVAVLAGQPAAHLGLAAPGGPAALRGVQPGEELPLLVEEVDHGVGRSGHLGETVGEGVQGGLRPFPEAESAQPARPGGSLLVLRREQQTTCRTRRVVAHGRAPSLWTYVICGSGGVGCGRHMWAPRLGWGAAGAWAMRCLTRVSRVWTPEAEIRASQRTTGTDGSRSMAARTSSGS